MRLLLPVLLTCLLVSGCSEARDAVGGAAVELARLHLHRFGQVAHRLDPQRLGQPDRPAADEALHVLPADQLDVLAEPLAV